MPASIGNRGPELDGLWVRYDGGGATPWGQLSLPRRLLGTAQSQLLPKAHPLGPGLVAEARAQRLCSALGDIVIPGSRLLPPKIPPT